MLATPLTSRIPKITLRWQFDDIYGQQAVAYKLLVISSYVKNVYEPSLGQWKLKRERNV